MNSLAATCTEDHAAPSDGRHSTSPIPPHCSPQRFVDWRLRFAGYLADNADQLPIEREDPWVEEAARFCL